MRTLGSFAVVLLTVFVYVHADEELYSDKYDYIDPREILNNDRLRAEYYNCFMDTGPCVTPDAAFFKGNFPEAIVTHCKKCTEKQKQNFEIMVEWYTEHEIQEWNALVDKFISDAKKMNGGT